jgi:hypothetical protein
MQKKSLCVALQHNLREILPQNLTKSFLVLFLEKEHPTQLIIKRNKKQWQNSK